MNRRAPFQYVRTPEGRMARLRPVRLFHLRRSRAQTIEPILYPPQPESAESNQSNLQPIPSGQFYRVISPVEESLVTPPLAIELSKALEQFAQSNGFSAEQPLDVLFKRGVLGLHRFARAADIYAVGG